MPEISLPGRLKVDDNLVKNNIHVRDSLLAILGVYLSHS
ncbi:hypothetical protein ECL_B115 (plasmid) [Enterobacter cloacae subsp. cloacae ATCC 13047]|uniref:Uncharacterized protein n=1 Tax=Enterobacter cloacae subsp. cloacae (strain ATCC 13047 / DSM 30054 / NBRC 13535 / NCTC 10005 / WDCM 00083 / NCDC 279-56) TaxID=716541 RepID=A0A0H3CU70_ENTCC|nr:hypothetical protein ECL_B115 [Enterobacter cloacae subsp. cloacae ATCC 13047]OOC92283.1 hypothetical protein BWP06_03565 [Enterobacter cloacae]